MLINGEKWACETCIKGHRATHCKHTDRKLISIKKKGRPATQCKRCRELRVLRQLHVKCDCEDSGPGVTKKNSNSNSSPSLSSVAPRKRKKVESLRPLAPKISESKGCCNSSKPLPPPSSSSPSTPAPSTPTTPIAHVTPEPVSSCCSKKSLPSTATSTPPPPPAIASLSFIPADMDSSPSILPLEPVPLPVIPPPSSCCGPPSKNQQGETIRVVTCRCGDSCACIGCDAHPSRAMKEGKNDVYIGFDTSVNSNKRRLSIAAICATSSASTPATRTFAPFLSQQQQQDHPTSILAEDGTVLCGCGCSRAFAECSDCFRELCDGYFN
ncbi:uncharacterized protein ATC70_003699 [Mucor velutinosus]|uniref:Copper-fist domain-containing protein n=1 Tax=Mucor velutinosus TaxID=708070 RepID=A0AAN7D8V7_9FUNG|nr:hypothetical protein ATC70_003699 [Mucor velutinosus]